MDDAGVVDAGPLITPVLADAPMRLSGANRALPDAPKSLFINEFEWRRVYAVDPKIPVPSRRGDGWDNPQPS
jgi:hypothetical protein